jgi:Cof subfamily protein (haloacid dehalogenase superfamily)
MGASRRTVYVTDLDGTLLGADARLSEHGRSVLARLLGEGMLFTVASARSVVAMQRILAGLELRLPVVEFNGAFISELASGEHLITNAMPGGLARLAYDCITGSGMLPFVSSFDGTADRLYHGRMQNEGMQWYLDDRRRNGDRRLRETGDLAATLDEQVVCLTAIERPGIVDELAKQMRTRFDGRLVIRSFRSLYSQGWSWLTVHDRAATKDRAVKTILEIRGLEDAEVVAFGDSDNDVPLFRIADRGVAVENASAELKNIASTIIGPCGSDSVVGFLEDEWRTSRAGCA